MALSPESCLLDSKSLNLVMEVWVKASHLLSVSFSKITVFLSSPVYTDHHSSQDIFLKDMCFLLNEIIKKKKPNKTNKESKWVISMSSISNFFNYCSSLLQKYFPFNDINIANTILFSCTAVNRNFLRVKKKNLLSDKQKGKKSWFVSVCWDLKKFTEPSCYIYIVFSSFFSSVMKSGNLCLFDLIFL